MSEWHQHLSSLFLGLLGKKVEDLSKTITDLLVRQKQVKLSY